MVHSAFPPRFKQTFASQPFWLFRHSFWDNSNLVSLHFGLLISEDSSLKDGLVEMFERGHAYIIISDLELSALPYLAPITAICWLPEYRYYYMHKIIQRLCGKVICHSRKYTRDHWVMRREALTLYAIILYSPIEC